MHRLRAGPDLALRRRGNPGQYRAGIRPDQRLPGAWSFWVSNWVAQASVAVATASALSFIGPQPGPGRHPVAIGCVVVVTAVNAIGVRAAGGLSIVTVAIKILPLLAVIWLFAATRCRRRAYEPFAPVPVNFANVASATALTFFALTGFEAATAPVVQGPRRVADHPAGDAGRNGVRRPALPGCRNRHPAAAAGKRRCRFAGARSPTPWSAQWGRGAASFAALAIAISAFGCLNCLILGDRRARLFDGAARRPARGHGAHPRSQHAGCRAIGRIGADHPADPRQQQPRHRQPVHLRHPAFDRGGARRLSRRRAGRLESEPVHPARGRSSSSRCCSSPSPSTAPGWKPTCGAWCCLAIGLAIRCRYAPPQFASRLQPGGGGDSSRASGISRRSFCAKLRRHTSLVPSGPAT